MALGLVHDTLVLMSSPADIVMDGGQLLTIGGTMSTEKIISDQD